MNDSATARPMTRALACLLLAILLAACTADEQHPSPGKGHKELLILCGITMIDPVRELMEGFERRTGVKMVMSYGGSADLLHSMTLNKTGDLYFPGSEGFIAEADSRGELGERLQVGINRAAIFVRKGNPKGLTGNLEELLSSEVQVGIGHPELGSVGKEAKRIFDKMGLYDRLIQASATLAPDSKALSSLLRDGKVDAVLNWQAVLYLQDNVSQFEVLPIKDGLAEDHKLTMAVTVHSRQPALAKSFLELCASQEGRAVFARYGF